MLHELKLSMICNCLGLNVTCFSRENLPRGRQRTFWSAPSSRPTTASSMEHSPPPPITHSKARSSPLKSCDSQKSTSAFKTKKHTSTLNIKWLLRSVAPKNSRLSSCTSAPESTRSAKKNTDFSPKEPPMTLLCASSTDQQTYACMCLRVYLKRKMQKEKTMLHFVCIEERDRLGFLLSYLKLLQKSFCSPLFFLYAKDKR